MYVFLIRHFKHLTLTNINTLNTSFLLTHMPQTHTRYTWGDVHNVNGHQFTDGQPVVPNSKQILPALINSKVTLQKATKAEQMASMQMMEEMEWQYPDLQSAPAAQPSQHIFPPPAQRNYSEPAVQMTSLTFGNVNNVNGNQITGDHHVDRTGEQIQPFVF